MSREAISKEVDQNYDFFQRQLAKFVDAESGRFALIRHRKILGFYDDPGAAAQEGARQFPDSLFSIQEVTDAPIDLGLYSYAPN